MDYYSYLLRIWKNNDGRQEWRASLESIPLGEEIGFPNLEALITFLKEQTKPETKSTHLDDEQKGDEDKDKLG